MKRVLSERNLVVILFVAALTVFSFAQEDADKNEKMSQGSKVSSILQPHDPTAESLTKDAGTANFSESK